MARFVPAGCSRGTALKVATFTVRADVRQSARWKQSAEAEGFQNVGAWLARAADAYMKARAAASLPISLSWRAGVFSMLLAHGETVRVQGKMAPPFAYYEGTEAEVYEGRGRRRYTLLFIPSGRPLATLLHARDCKALAAELARSWVRWDGQSREPPGEDQGQVLSRLL
jgi:hypothetical protein